MINGLMANGLWYFNSPPPFTFSFTFTNAGATGRTGPTSTALTDPSGYNSIYPGVGTPNALTITGGIQYWTVPASGLYLIIAAGARGGNSDPSYPPGSGIIVSNQVTFTNGQIIKILVGQHGIDGANGTGGGGGTFITTDTNSILLIAGGGSGSTYKSQGSNGVTTAGSGNGGISGGVISGGGGGYTTSGENGTASTGGESYINGGAGGNGTISSSSGGFGGGGGSGGDTMTTGTFPAKGKGGGGGYTGGNVSQGGSSYDSTNSIGNYNATKYTQNVNGKINGNNNDDGFVIITKL